VSPCCPRVNVKHTDHRSNEANPSPLSRIPAQGVAPDKGGRARARSCLCAIHHTILGITMSCRCSFGGLGCCSCRVRVCVGVGGVVVCRCVCVCPVDLFTISCKGQLCAPPSRVPTQGVAPDKGGRARARSCLCAIHHTILGITISCRCSFGGLGCCSCRVRVCVGVGGVVVCRVCVCDLLIFLYNICKCQLAAPPPLMARLKMSLQTKGDAQELRYWAVCDSPSKLLFVCYTPYNIGNHNIV